MNETVTVYSKPACGGCAFTKKYLEKLGVAFEEVDVTKVPDGLKHIKSLGYSSLPVVEYGDTHFTGFQQKELDKIASSISKGA